MISEKTKAHFFGFVQELVPQHGLSRLIGAVAASTTEWVKNAAIAVFRYFFKVNLQEAEFEDPKAYSSFNHFFTRALKPDARPLPTEADAFVSPADGAVSESGPIVAGRLIQAKNHDYRLDELLPVPLQDWTPFVNGDFATIYLAPSDYHRVHMPMDATLLKTVYVPGKLYSVNQATASSIPRLFAKNERLIAFFDTAQGPLCMVLVGAMIVSGIETVFNGLYRTRQGELLWNDQPLTSAGEQIIFKKGDEFGRFLLGSTVILLTAPKMVSYYEFTQGQKVRCRGKIGHIL